MTSPCFDASLAERAVIGPLDPAEREALMQHAEVCDACLGRLSDAARRLVSAGPDEALAALAGVEPAKDDDAASPGGLFAGRYVLLDTLGRGGMGVVHLAHDTVLGREVALKVVREATARSAAMIRDEAQALAAIVHPHVVTVYDLAVDGDRVAIAMERVRGMTLRERLQRFAPSRRVRVRALIAMSRGIAAAHEAGVVHGDVKLDNALVDARGHVRVTDFGLAHLVGRAGAAAGGTACFAAPEVAAGAPPTEAADQYALATAWLDALTGSRPTGPSEWQGLARRASPRWVRAPLARALAEAPSARHASVAALLANLERGRARFVSALVLAVALALVGPWAAVAHHRASALDACVAAALAELPEALDELRDAAPRPPEEAPLWAMAAADYRAWRDRFAARHATLCESPAEHRELAACLETERRWVVDDLALGAQGPQRASGALVNLGGVLHDDLCADPNEQRALATLSERDPSMSGLEGAHADAFRRAAYAAPAELTDLVDSLEPGPPSRVLVTTLLFRAAAHERMLALDAAQGDAERAFELATQLRRRDLMSRAAVKLGSLAVQARGDLRDARFWARVARTLAAEASWPRDRWFVAELEMTLAAASGRSHDLIAAARALAADPVAAVLIGPRLRAVEGLALVDTGALGEAADALERALDERLAAPDTEPSRVAGAMHNLARLARALDDAHGAYLWVRDARALRAHLPDEHPDRLTLARTEARLLAELFGRYDEASEQAEWVLTLSRRRFPSHHVDVLTSLGVAAECARLAGLTARAEELAHEGAELARRHDFGGTVAALPFLVLADLGRDPEGSLREALTRLGPVQPSAPLCERVRRHAAALGTGAGACTLPGAPPGR